MPIIIDEYLGETDNLDELRDQFLDLLGDAAIISPSVKMLNYHKGKIDHGYLVLLVGGSSENGKLCGRVYKKSV